MQDPLYSVALRPAEVDARKTADWPYLSFQRCVQSGMYNLEVAADDNVRRLEME